MIVWCGYAGDRQASRALLVTRDLLDRKEQRGGRDQGGRTGHPPLRIQSTLTVKITWRIQTPPARDLAFCRRELFDHPPVRDNFRDAQILILESTSRIDGESGGGGPLQYPAALNDLLCRREVRVLESFPLLTSCSKLLRQGTLSTIQPCTPALVPARFAFTNKLSRNFSILQHIARGPPPSEYSLDSDQIISIRLLYALPQDHSGSRNLGYDVYLKSGGKLPVLRHYREL